MTEPSLPEPARLRAGDADRDRAARVLGQALGEGRLSPVEHAERLDAVFSARTVGELAVIVEDLPADAAGLPSGLVAWPGPRVVPAPAAEDLEPAVRDTMVTVFSGTVRQGHWWVSPEVRSICVFGGVQLDLREARLSQRHITIRAICVFGGIEVTVPEGMHVVSSASAVFGGVDVPPSLPPAPDAPTVYLRGFCLFGGISVRRKKRKNLE